VANIIKITTDVIENAGLLGEWNRHVGDLFWHYINGKLHLGFEFWVERFPSLEQSKFGMLERVGITSWEILKSISENNKEERLEKNIDKLKNHWEKIKSKSIDEFTETYKEIFEGIKSFDELFNIIPFDGIIGVLNPYKELDQDNSDYNIDEFSVDQLFNELVNRISLYKFNENDLDFTNIFNDLILKFENSSNPISNSIKPHLADEIHINSENVEKYENNIMTDWNDLSDIRLSRFKNLNEFNILDFFPDFSKLNLLKIAEIMMLNPVNLEMFEWLLKTGLYSHIWQNENITDYQAWLQCGLQNIAITIAHDYFDAFESYGFSFIDDFIIAFIGLTIFYCSEGALTSENLTTHQKNVAEYFQGIGMAIFIQALVEGVTEAIRNKLNNMISDALTDRQMAIIETVATLILAIGTFNDFIEEGFISQLLWTILDISFGVSQSIIPLVKESKIGLVITIIIQIISFIFFEIQIIY